MAQSTKFRILPTHPQPNGRDRISLHLRMRAPVPYQTSGTGHRRLPASSDITAPSATGHPVSVTTRPCESAATTPAARAFGWRDNAHRRASEGGTQGRAHRRGVQHKSQIQKFSENFSRARVPSGLASPREPKDPKPFSVLRPNSQVHRSHRGYRGVPSWAGVGSRASVRSCCVARRSAVCCCDKRLETGVIPK